MTLMIDEIIVSVPISAISERSEDSARSPETRKLVYAGITNDFARREGEWAGTYALEQITGYMPRNAARGIEQSIIYMNSSFTNKINSISPIRDFYGEATSFGKAYLGKSGWADKFRSAR